MSLPTQLIHLRLSNELLQLLTDNCQTNGQTRNEFIRQAITEKLRQTVPNVLPSKGGVNILMTDAQLEDLLQTIQSERRRRYYKGQGY